MTKPEKDPQQPPDAIVTGSGAIATGGGVAAGQGGAAAGEGGIALVVSGRVGTVNLSTDAVDPAAALNAPYAPLPPDISRQPNLLLRAVYGVVPFRPRGDHLQALEAWAKDGTHGGLAILTGPGGSGKTRLAAELAQRRRADRWTAGFLQLRPTSAGLAGLVKSTAPVLAVVDDAESRLPLVLDVLELLAGHRLERPWRVVLLSRTAGDWWEERLPGELRDSPAEVFVGAAPRHDLEAMEPALTDRADAFAAAEQAFAGALDKRATAVPSPDLSHPRYGRPLFLQMAALSTVLTPEDERAGPTEPSTLLADALVRERAYWRASATAKGLELQDTELARCVAVACLVDVNDEESAAESLRAVPELTGESEGRRRLQVAQWLHDLYPADSSGSWMPGVDPDVLAEAHVAKAFEDSQSLANSVLGALPADRAEKALALLTGAATEHPVANAALEAILTTRLAELVLPAIAVAQQVGDPLGRILADALERDPRPQLVDAVNEALPDTTVALSELAVVAAKSAFLRARADGPTNRSTRLASNLAVRLSAVGQYEDALEMAEEAVAGYRELASQWPDSYEAELATGLTILSGRLSDLGRSKEALAACLEAVEISRELLNARRRPAGSDRPLGLTAVLKRVFQRDRSGNPVPPIETGLSPSDEEPGEQDALRADLAGRLAALSRRLHDVGRRKEALASGEEALGIYRDLAAAHPAAFQEDLAGALASVATILSDLDLHRRALDSGREAVAILRELALARPDTFREQVAGLLNDVSTYWSEVGERENAISAIQESATIVSELAAARPEAFGPMRTMVLINLSNRLAEIGRGEEGIEVGEDAVATSRKLAAARPDVYQAYLAGALNNLSAQLSGLDRREDALTAIKEAVAIHRELAQADPGAFQADLALALTNLSSTLAELGRFEEALSAAGEMVAIQREVAVDWPDVSSPDLAAALFNQATILAASGRHEDAAASFEEAVAGYRALAEAHPGEFDDQLKYAVEIMASGGDDRYPAP